MKKILALALPLLLAAWSARADVIYQDVFSYSNGPIADVSTNIIAGVLVTNWFTHSGSDDDFVSTNQLQISSSSTYLGVTTTRSGDVHRFFSITNNSPYTNVQQVLYASFIVTFTNMPQTNGAGSYFAHFYYSSTTFGGKLWGTQGNPGAAAPANFSGLPGTFRLGVSQGGTSSTFVNKVYPVDLALNTPYQVVMGFNPTTAASSDGNLPFADTITLWINPLSPADPNVVSGDPFTVPANAATAFAFRQASNFGGFLNVSNLVLSTTFPEAATNVLRTNAVAPTIVYQPPAITTNFQNATVSLSAVANGQGLGSLAYQWQVTNSASTTPANVSGATANILSVDTTTIGNNYYTLVVTTPWGLSTTSSVAKVAIRPPVGPPLFVTQPVSQTAYTNATVTLTTTVTTPGNITSFTWFSNNVVVTAGQADAGVSSSLTIPNVTIASSATYKVAVTNDTQVNGVVSTNAVLTVVSPQTATIKFLRTLVDPVTFIPTNAGTIAYSVTGVVTTFTNITTGDTSSYWLQDGTGGINIFATFGSTFRPARGDQVTFVGVLSSFTSGIELFADTNNRPYTSYFITSSGNALPAAQAIPYNLTNTVALSAINTNIAGSLVILSDVYFGTNSGNTITAPSSGSLTVAVTNSAGAKFNLSFFSSDPDTQGQILPTYATSVTGILYGLSPNYSLAVTKFSDIVTLAPPPPTLGFSQAGNALTFSWSDASYNLQSQTNSLNVGLMTNNASWFNYPGSSPVVITIDPASPTVFFRLLKP